MGTMALQTVHDALRDLYGPVDFGAALGVVQVVATTQADDGLRVLRIEARTPRSDTDRFILGFSRARADAIITTGKILRDEPELRYDLPLPEREGLLAWREEVRRQTASPQLIVLTRDPELDLDHPALHSWASPILYTTPSVAERWKPHFEAVGDPACSLRSAVAWARRRGAKVISIEAGPRTARNLYRDPCAVDEVLLSIAAFPVSAAIAGELLFDRKTIRRLGKRQSSITRTELSGPWRFERWRPC